MRHPKRLEGLLLMVLFNTRALLSLLYANTVGAILVSFSCEMAQLSPLQMKADKDGRWAFSSENEDMDLWLYCVYRRGWQESLEGIHTRFPITVNYRLSIANKQLGKHISN